MQRDMSYDLDAVFAGRNAGELRAVAPMKTRVLRTPGLVSVNDGPGEEDLPRVPRDTLVDAEPEDLDSPAPRNAPGLAAFDMSFDVPGIGKVDVKSIAIGAGIAVLACMLLKKRR